jgi:kynurenine formamidase
VICRSRTFPACREVAGTRFALFVGALKIIGGDGAWARVLALPST